MENRKVIIVGAGIGGLSAGYWLSQRGYDVEILEGADRASGRMAVLERKGDRVDVGAQFYHSDFRNILPMIDAMGLSGAKRIIAGNIHYRLQDGSSFVYDHRVPYMKLLGLRGNLKLYWFMLKYVFFGHQFPMYGVAKDIPEYDDTEVLELFKSPADKPLRDYLVTTMSMGENMGLPEWMNLYEFIHMFRMTTFSKFFGLTRGVASLTEELAKRLPIQYEARVRQIVVEHGRVVGVEMENDGVVKKAGHVVVAVTPPSAARLMPEGFEEQREFFDSVIHSPFPMPVFFLDRPLRKDIWCYFNDPAQRRTFMFAVDEHAKIPEMCPSGKAVLTGWSGHPMTRDLIDRPDDEIVEKAKEDIELMIPGFSNWIEDVTVFRHPYGTARFPVGSYRQMLDFLKRAKQLKGVSFVSDVFGGSCMEGAMVSAAAAVRRVCQWGGTAS